MGCMQRTGATVGTPLGKPVHGWSRVSHGNHHEVHNAVFVNMLRLYREKRPMSTTTFGGLLVVAMSLSLFHNDGESAALVLLAFVGVVRPELGRLVLPLIAVYYGLRRTLCT